MSDPDTADEEPENSDIKSMEAAFDELAGNG